MRRGHLTAAAAITAAALVPMLSWQRSGDALRPAAVQAQSRVLTVPKAECGPADRSESGLQGQTTLAERFGGLAEMGFNCNLELVGQYEGEGASWQMTWFADCAYYVTANSPLQARRGSVVVDASDPANPRGTAILDSRAMLDPWESLKVNTTRKLLGATKGPGGVNDRYFAFYDIKDCANPKLLADVDVPGHWGHAGDFAPDGMTYYGTATGRPGVTAMDISDPRNPRLITIDSQFQLHDVTFNADGTRMYGTQIGLAGRIDQPNGLVVLDVSDIQHRRPNPKIRLVSRLVWPDGGAAQVAQPVRIQGKPYLVFVDELSGGGLGAPGSAAACAQGLPPFGFARIIDIADERHPQTVSKLMLEVHDPANCAEVLPDPRPSSFGYDSHYCTVDNPNNAKLLGCGHFGAGLRVFDIRDPRNPKEIAYYKPPARRTEFRPGSQYGVRAADRTTDWSSSNVRFYRSEGGDLQVWFTSHDNGFQIVRFTNGLLARTGLDRFDQDHPGNRN